MKIPEKVLITDKLYIVIVECLLYLFYHSKRLYLLFTYPYPWSFMSKATSVTGSVNFLCEGAFWHPVWMKKTSVPGFTDKAWA